MSKLSFVALSLQTTHLDPASVSKASYVKLVDGNITRQDEIPILPPTNKQHKHDQDAHHAPTPWNEALEQLRMMVGKLPIVSYYRDADKEIYQAASRHLNIEPPAFHWLDCRELARKLLPDLADVQLSTVLKTLDLYRDFADSSAVVQTAQIVTALAERQDANTVRELWHELYHQPEELLGLDTTFEGAVESAGSSSDDEERVEGPLAADVLPLAPEQGNSLFSQQTSPETVVPHTEHEAEASTSDLDDSVEQPTNTQNRPEEAPLAIPDEHLPMASTEQTSEAFQVEQPDPDPPPQELPEFLQEPLRDDEVLETAEAFDAPSKPVSPPEGDLTVGSEPSEMAAVDHDSRTDGAPSPLDPLEHARHGSPDDTEQTRPYEYAHDETQLQTQSGQSQETADGAPFEEQGGIEEPAFLQETAPEELEQHDPGVRSAPEAESLDVPAVDLPPTRSAHLTDASNIPGGSPLPSAPSSMAAESAQPRQTQMSVSERPMDLEAIKVSKIPPIPAPSPESSRTNKVFGFLGLFVFGVLTIIGVVLTVMAVMLFFTENSLMLETKIAGVILTGAITLLSLLMANVSYRSFRRK